MTTLDDLVTNLNDLVTTLDDLVTTLDDLVTTLDDLVITSVVLKDNRTIIQTIATRTSDDLANVLTFITNPTPIITTNLTTILTLNLRRPILNTIVQH